MGDAIIVLNAGSSSLKFSIYQAERDELALVSRGQIEGLGTSPHFKAKDRKGSVLADLDLNAPAGVKFGHPEAFAHLAKWMREEFGGQLSPIAVGHRVVHGGSDFTAPVVITDDVLNKLNQLVPLVPL